MLRVAVVVALVAFLAVVFGEAIFGGGMFAFRDGAHYYNPLFRFTAAHWADGELPLWNAYENLGQPLAGDPTASLFYPGKLVFLLPLRFAWCYKLYVIGHVLLAAGSAYWLSRHFGASVPAAGISALSYAFCGNVLTQYCNVVFLIGAAWLPIALMAADRMLTSHAPRQAAVLGMVLAMMVLGGDVQMAYNTGLLAVLWAIWLWRHKPKEPQRVLRSRMALLAFAAITGLVLCAIQVLPAIEFAQRCSRGTAGFGSRLLARTEPDTHEEHTYHFSVGPWRLAEYLWPNVSGRQYPIHRRWLEVIPAEGRIWSPTLYMGILPILLATAMVRLRRPSLAANAAMDLSPVRTHWLSWITLLATIASFGWFGLGWAAGELCRAITGHGMENIIGPPWGGLYWLMTLLLPGYASFRYPAKLMVVAALGLSLLAAFGWDRHFAVGSTSIRRWLGWLAAASGSGALLVFLLRPFWDSWLSGLPPDMLFGPFDAAGSHRDLLGGLLQTAALCVVFYGLLRWRHTATSTATAVVPVAAILLCAVDLGWANGWIIQCAPQEIWEKPSRYAVAVMNSAEETDGGRARPAAAPRVFRHPIWLPPQWKATASNNRLAEAAAWERDTLSPKYNLAAPLALTEVEGALKLHDYQVYCGVAARRPQSRLALADFAVLPVVAPLGMDEEECRSGLVADAAAVPDAKLWGNRKNLPRAWIVHHYELLPELEDTSSAAVRQRTEYVLCPAGRWRDMRHEATVEYGRPGSDPLANPLLPGRDARHGSRGDHTTDVSSETCHITRYGLLRVEIEVELKQAGLVVLAEQYFPGWQWSVATTPQLSERPASPRGSSAAQAPATAIDDIAPTTRQDTPLLRVNRVMQAARGSLPEDIG